ncbi:MAG: hypothetical protein D6733_05110 [Methanobacteriota archaeon]|nr:MAG: hypothetical protein D6733_05110 [Euryarchaeota archaeon]
MGMAKLNVWVSGLDDPCKVDNRTWYVTIYDCDGNVLEWCGKKYVVLPAKCGHLEVEVPPGCYYIKAVWGYKFVGGVYYVNHFTDAAIVQARCDETVCVKLYAPTAHRCGLIYLHAVRDLARQKAIPPAVAKKVEGAIGELLEHIPRPVKGFELDHIEELERLVKAQAKEEGLKAEQAEKR